MLNVLFVPSYLWSLYVTHLWNYEPGSWVDDTASTFRLLAFVVIAPFVLLTLLDVTSYVIARTLGVIDDTKASTSESGTSASSEASTPAIVIQDDTTPSAPSTAITTPPAAYFRDPMEEEGNLQLAGVDMFSPAPSQPPSPILSRRELALHMHNLQEESQEQPTARDPSWDSSSGESSFTILDRESGAEDAQVTLRRRARAEAGM
ncbi:uncharacterized protein LAESUDRAFT_734664 [Laetiporus sulphureus 93-53]|uniref:Uncharacterized protein n=1 Tax=Laetiporus sulphureus 93-53 TaxID=1314785 RepID=A0A165GX77_9APHY|nr:uncharacterized protein LAESUDRAFT_734664 [Laetiporus sulphureus 93-53]KZT10952.1 hypothetical protein LAESUDRAFT_734664 [Laetiporus sulphureus 93-53]